MSPHNDPAATAEDALPPIEQIASDDVVLRKIEDVPHLHPRDGGGRRISAAAFSPSSPKEDPEQGMSCNSEAILKRKGGAVETLAPHTPVLARLPVSSLREMGLEVVHRPLKGDHSHCNVLNVKGGHRSKLLNLAELVRCPPDVHKK